MARLCWGLMNCSFILNRLLLGNRAYAFGYIRLGLPYGLAVVRPDGSLNFQDLVQTLASPESQAEPPFSTDRAKRFASRDD